MTVNLQEIVGINAAAPRILAAMARAIAPRERISVSEWADKHRVLSRKGSAKPGRWVTARNPPLREIMDCFSAYSPVHEVVAMLPIQFGKSDGIVMNVVGYSMTNNPGPIMVALPGEVALNKFINQKLNPAFEETPAMREALASTASRDTANQRAFKEFEGGQIYVEHAGNPLRLKSTSVKILINDEHSQLAAALKMDDPEAMLEGRLSAFPGTYKRLDISTPDVAGVCRTEARWLKSDQRRYYVPCPECGHRQYLKWSGLHWNEDATACWYVCEDCGSCIEEHHKTQMIEQGGWVPGKPGAPIRGYHINALYYPFGLGPRWLRLVHMWLDAQGDPAKLKTFINDRLAETFEDPAMRAVKHNLIADRAEPIPLRLAPPWVLAVTAGVDTQDNRLPVIITGWGRGMSSWILDYVELPGDPNDEAVWLSLVELINRPIQSQLGGLLRVEALLQDGAGHRTEAVKAFVRRKLLRRHLIGFGAAQNNAPVLNKGKLQDINWRGQVDKKGITVHQVGTVGIKHLLYGRLSADADKPADSRMVRFSNDLPNEFFEGLVSEVYDPRKNRFEKRRGGARNEPLDCFDEQTEVLTRNGWQRFNTLTFASELATVNLATDLIEYQRPMALIDKPYEGEMVEIKGARIDILVTPNHRMVTLEKKPVTLPGGKRGWSFEVEPKITLAKDLTVHTAIKINAGWQGRDDAVVMVPPSFNEAGGIIEPERAINAGDLAALLGWYVSEGSSFQGRSRTQGNLRRRVAISQRKPAGREAIKKLLDRLPWAWRADGDGFVCTSKQLHNYLLSECGRYQHERVVPWWVRQASSRIIAAFVDAAMAGDGWQQQAAPHHRPSRTYATTSKVLADQMQELFLKLGRAANIRTVMPKGWQIEGRSGTAVREQYHVTERLASRAYLDGGGQGRRGYFGRRVPYSGRVYCASVPNGTLVVRRGGKSFIAGNCWVYSYAAAHHPALRLHRATKADWDAREARLRMAEDSRSATDGSRGTSISAPPLTAHALTTRAALDAIVCQVERHPLKSVSSADLAAWLAAEGGTPEERELLSVVLDQLDHPAAPISSLLDARLVDKVRAVLTAAPSSLPRRAIRGTRHAGVR